MQDRGQEGLASLRVPLSLLPPSKAQGPGRCPCTSTDTAQGETDHRHPEVQSHRWAKVKEMTVLLHRAQHRLDSAMRLSPTN